MTLFAAATACFGSQASSATIKSRSSPRTPPLALISLTAISAPRFNCSPCTALEPVIGPTTAILMSCALASPAVDASAAAQITDWTKRFMNPSWHRFEDGLALGTGTVLAKARAQQGKVNVANFLLKTAGLWRYISK